MFLIHGKLKQAVQDLTSLSQLLCVEVRQKLIDALSNDLWISGRFEFEEF
jgi:hypothetical protein